MKKTITGQTTGTTPTGRTVYQFSDFFEPRPLTGKDCQRIAHELPLIKRTITVQGVLLQAALLAQKEKSQELANVATLALNAACAVRRFCQSMELFCRKRYPRALWLHTYEELSEDQDPFEWLPLIVQVRKNTTPPAGAAKE